MVKLVSRLKNNYNISDHNIFVTGMSNGGEMSYMLVIGIGEPLFRVCLIYLSVFFE